MIRWISRLFPQHRRKSFVSDREFLAPALSILETPPSPVGTALLLLICLLAIVAITWATLGYVNVAVTAPGKLEPLGQVRTVQVLETGRVYGINVANGSRVKAGDVLFTLDSTTLALQHDRLSRDEQSARAEVLRREAAIRAARSATIAEIEWPTDIPHDIQQREDDVFHSDLGRLKASQQELRARMEQQAADQVKLDQTITVESHLLDVLQQPVRMQEQLQQQGIGSRVNLVQAQASMERQNSVVIQAMAQRRQLAASMTLAQDQLQSALDTFVADQTQRLTSARRGLDRVAAQAAVAQVALERMTIRAPVSGTVQSTNITTTGQVFQVGQEAMRIVPDDVPLQIIAEARNQDIGFIEVGQSVSIKVNAFPFTQFGMLQGRVVQIAGDAITSGDAQFSQASPGQAGRAEAPQSQQQVLNLVFPVTIAIDQPELRINGRRIPVKAGMQVSAEIDTGSRRIIEYVLAPITETLSNAGKER